MAFDYDLFVIGAGSAGLRASRVAARYGARVAVAEERYLGGTCVNVGCIPKKLLLFGAHFAADFADAASYGWAVGYPTFDWPTLIAAKDGEIARLNGVYRRLLDDAGVRRVEGRARLLDAHMVGVGAQRFTAAYVLIATGAWPVIPPIPGRELAITSNEVFFLDQLPPRVVIVGGGYVGVELAGIFHGLGSQVVQTHRGDLFLRGFDDDVRQALAVEMRRTGVDLRFGVNVAAIERAGAGLRAQLSDGSAVETDAVLFATGRAPHTADLGLQAAAVECTATGAIAVDAYSRTSVPNIYAVGDVTDRLMLTPVAIAEGQAFAETVFNATPTKPDYCGVPSAVFSQPPVATVGLTEAAARASLAAVDIYRSSFTPLKHSLTGRGERTTIKLVVDAATQRVVGCHMVGADAPEIIQGLALALKCGATKAQFDATIGIHPTAAEEFFTLRTRL